jgi:hypothetical protein
MRTQQCFHSQMSNRLEVTVVVEIEKDLRMDRFVIESHSFHIRVYSDENEVIVLLHNLAQPICNIKSVVVRRRIQREDVYILKYSYVAKKAEV